MKYCSNKNRDTGVGEGGGDLCPPKFGISVNPIKTKGQIMPAILLLASIFLENAASLKNVAVFALSMV